MARISYGFHSSDLLRLTLWDIVLLLIGREVKEGGLRISLWNQKHWERIRG